MTPDGRLERSAATATAELSANERTVADYLLTECAATDGDLYVKSRFLAEDLDLSPNEIGACLAALSETEGELVVERWGYSSATTWRITHE